MIVFISLLTGFLLGIIVSIIISKDMEDDV